MKHVIKTQTFTREFLKEIFDSANKMRDAVKSNTNLDNLRGKVVATLFYEESTRTRLSFETAALRLGASVISSTNARQFSSVSKGESLEDTIQTLNGYADCIVLRYYKGNGAARAAHFSKVPIINGGSGSSGQHPTQSLLDLFTIKDELGSIDGLNIALVGDLKHGRTIHSLAYLLGKFNNIKISFISPDNLSVPSDILDYLERHNIEFNKYNELTDLDKFDVLYQTRVQKERFDNPEEYEKSKGNLIITKDIANSMKNDAIILHPLPRVDEISYEVDSNHRAKYFIQAENGLYVRMALLNYILR